MDNNIILSIVTIAKNEEKRIIKTIESIKWLKKRVDIEHILVIADSNDNTYNLAKDYVLANKNTRLINQTGRGISEAFNIGIMESRGKYINFINSGDILDSNLQIIDQIIDGLNELNTELLFMSVKYSYKNKTTKTIEPKPNDIFNKMSVFHPSTLFLRSALVEIGGFCVDYKLAMDCEIMHRMIIRNNSWKVANINWAIMDADGISDQMYIRSAFEFIKSLKQNQKLSISAFYCNLNILIKKTIIRLLRR